MGVGMLPHGEKSSVRFRVDGMDCASCASKVETVVRRVPGVEDLSVNVTTGLLDISARDHVDREAIVKSVRRLGYGIEPVLARNVVPLSAAGGGCGSASCCDGGHEHHRHEGENVHSAHGHDHGPNCSHGHVHDHGSGGHHADGREHPGDRAVPIPPPPASPGDAQAAADALPWWRKAKGRLVIALAVLVGGAMLLALAEPGYAQWIFTAAAVIGVVPFARRAVTLARAGFPFSIETLMSVAVIGAVAIGAAEEGAVVVLLFAVGELIEGIAAGSARTGIRSLSKLMPLTALIEENGQRFVDVKTLRPGQILIVRPGDRVATDGNGDIVEGISDLDEAAITGESVPVTRGPGEGVFAGSINANSLLRVRVTRTVADNTIARIIEEVENAQSKKAPLARFIDDFSRWYTPAAMVLAALVATIPPLAFGGEWGTWVYRALALLLIACPCALVLSTPAAIASGIAAAARRGLLIKSGAALETLGRVTSVAFDKTGTLTAGEPRVTDVNAIKGTVEEVLSLAAAVESGSSHPIAKAITAAAAERSLQIAPATEASADPGRGVSATAAGRRLTVVSPRAADEFMDDETRSSARGHERAGKTVVALVDGQSVLGLIAVRDEPRPDAKAAVAALVDLGVRAVMLTGDNERTARAVAASLGLEAKAQLMPSDKLAAIEAMKLNGPVAMVGDGINDAPALAAASVGVAMGGGTEVAISTADAALLGGRVRGVAELIQISRATLSNIRQNIALALGLKALFLLTSLFGVTSLWMAILADTGATVLVTANALRLLRLGRRSKERAATTGVAGRKERSASGTPTLLGGNR